MRELREGGSKENNGWEQEKADRVYVRRRE